MIATICLVALRLGVGWHFFMEGADKIHGNWSSVGFLSNAKGPLADTYKTFVWDVDGRYRLNLKTTLEAWDQFRARAVAHYGFDAAQTKKAVGVLKQHEGQLRWVLASNADDIASYFRNLERRQQQRARPEMEQVASLRGQGASLEGDIRRARGPWLATIDRLWAGYEQEMTALATSDQLGKGKLDLERPGRGSMDTHVLDKVIPYFDLAVGVCLMLGFCTRFAAIAGALFLASVVTTQWPGSAGAAPTYNQVVEMLALLVIAATGAGRYAGLDYIVEAARLRFFGPKSATPKSATEGNES